MGKKYNHWFWNSALIRWFKRRVAKLDSFLWSKMYKK